MKSRSKEYRSILESLDRDTVYSLEEGVSNIVKLSRGKYDESVELHMVMNLKGTKGPQSVRGTVLLSKPVGKEKRIVVLTEDESSSTAAKEAGADNVGGKELISQIKSEGSIDADVVIATPDFMRYVAPVAKILGPKGLMPSPKNGTTTQDVARAIQEFKAGKAEFRMDKSGVIHQSIGKVSFSVEDIVKNIQEFVGEVSKNKPEKVKGEFVKSAYLALTQSPSIKIKL